MTSRAVFILALRVLGAWAFLAALGGLTTAFATVYDLVKLSRSGEVGLARLVVGVWAGPTINCIAACVLWFLAPRIAAMFYGQFEDGEDEANLVSLPLTDAYQIAIRILGIYALLIAVPSVARAVAAWRDARGVRSFNQYEIAAIVGAFLYIICAVALICGAKQIARWLSGIRYDPERPAD